ncbi:hypothetical protein STRTUCAR8_09747 [Streptomyces turgidiscabies Car8]|uniref:Uncharacterized protein n=1 Tax=Streptomyces turgidiscabies (strain Car8) TaxID=698760 RepID=L7FHE2_STRT8|nr:hypothetical protein STRTUCAR8_09747 [Streptomyces turgidiscabies Car8]
MTNPTHARHDYDRTQDIAHGMPRPRESQEPGQLRETSLGLSDNYAVLWHRQVYGRVEAGR